VLTFVKSKLTEHELRGLVRACAMWWWEVCFLVVKVHIYNWDVGS